MALSAKKLEEDPAYARVAAAEFDYVTAENEMKPEALEPAQGRFVWQTSLGTDPADRVVGFAQAHGMKVKGHTLLWHKQYPTWMLALSARGYTMHLSPMRMRWCVTSGGA